jgi:hypothetical protein
MHKRRIVALLGSFLMILTSISEAQEEKRVTSSDAGEKSAYLFAHLTKTDYGQMHYSLSKDGLHWHRVNEGKPVHESYRGHPDIIRGHDGRFYLLGNAGENGKHNSGTPIKVWTSGDLVGWEPVCEYLPDLSGIPDFKAPPANHFGAPKMFYDENDNTYTITWHSPSGTTAPWSGGEGKNYWDSMRTLYVTTQDFKEFSAPRRLLPYDFATIDVLIRREGNDYFAIIKDEREPSPEWPTGKSLRIARSKHATGPYGAPFATVSKPWREAPSLLIRSEGKGYYLYYEVYPAKAYEMTSAPSLAGPWKSIAAHVFSVPKNTRHGCIIAIDGQEYDGIINKFGVEASATDSFSSEIHEDTE